MIYGDQNQLKTLFLNIIDNAIKYTPQKGRIRVTIERVDSSAKVKIHDTGAGIPKKDIGNIFDRFYRTDKSRNSTGFGLGLSIAKSIVEAHRGSIEVNSRPSRGTIFTITLPLPQ